MTDNDVQKLKQMYGCSGNYKVKTNSIFARFVLSYSFVILIHESQKKSMSRGKIMTMKVLLKGGLEIVPFFMNDNTITVCFLTDISQAQFHFFPLRSFSLDSENKNNIFEKCEQ